MASNTSLKDEPTTDHTPTLEPIYCSAAEYAAQKNKIANLEANFKNKIANLEANLRVLANLQNKLKIQGGLSRIEKEKLINMIQNNNKKGVRKSVAHSQGR